MNKRFLVQLFCYYLIPLALILYLVFGIYFDIRIRPDIVSYGDYAFKLVLFIVIIKPLSVIFPKIKLLKTFMSYRRELGVLSFWLAVLHGFGLMYLSSLFTNFNKIFSTNLLLTGFIALIGMIILGITSNTLSAIKLKKNWKKLQYLTYPTFAIICIHKAIAEDEIKPYIVLLVYTILKIIEIKKNKT